MVPNEKNWINYRGYEFVVNPSDGIGRKLLLNGEYEPEVEEIINAHLETGDVAFDIGSNMGPFTICMRDTVGKTGTVYAFDPLPKNSDLLKNTINKNNLSNVRVINKAVGKDRDTMELYVTEQNTGNSTLYPDQEYDKKLQVDVVPLSDYTNDFDEINFIKVDVEGAELDVIESLSDQIKNVDYILIELHHYTEHHKDYNIEDLFTILDSHGSIIGVSKAPEYEPVEQYQNIETANELSDYKRVVWIGHESPSKIGKKT